MVLVRTRSPVRFPSNWMGPAGQANSGPASAAAASAVAAAGAREQSASRMRASAEAPLLDALLTSDRLWPESESGPRSGKSV